MKHWMGIAALTLIVSGCRAPMAQAQDNLWQAPPAVKFWYPPYANEQPEWDGSELELDLGVAAGKPMAVLEIALPAGMKTGERYRFRFEAASNPGAPLIVNAPEPDPDKAGKDGKQAARSFWAMHGAKAKMRDIVFTYDPDKADGGDKLVFFWNGDSVKKAPKWTFSNFTLTPAKDGENGEKAPVAMNAKSEPGEKGPFDVNFWYPPYAKSQPKWKNGEITVDLKGAAGKPMAVLEIALPEDLEKDADYVFKMTVNASSPSPLTVLVPEPNPKGDKDGDKFKPRGDWAMQRPGPNERVIEFVYRPDMVTSGSKIQLFWNEQQVKSGASFTLSKMSLEKGK